MSLAILNSKKSESEYRSKRILPIVLEGDDKVEHDNEWRTYRDRNPQ